MATEGRSGAGGSGTAVEARGCLRDETDRLDAVVRAGAGVLEGWEVSSSSETTTPRRRDIANASFKKRPCVVVGDALQMEICWLTKSLTYGPHPVPPCNPT